MTPRLAVVPELESELDDLFGRPLSEFTAARNELVKRLRQAGQDEAAERIKSLKKPSVPAWTVNQLARRDPDEVRALAEAGERLRKAQEAAFGGGGRETLREATVAERDAARRLTRLAQGLLAEEGRPPTRDVIERVGTLLRSAAVQPEAADLLVSGRLSEEVDPTGFGTAAEIAPPLSKRATAKPKADDSDRHRREQELRMLRTKAAQLKRKAAESEERAERAEEAARAARAKAEEARVVADEAAAALEATRE
jgi:hypothetical protein